MIGETVGNYRIVSKLSIGGMGTVYKAEHTLIGKHAAVKVLHPELTRSEDILKRFFNEAKATTTIKHPGIVEIFDYGLMSSGSAYLVMEFLEGMSLAQRLKLRGPMSEGEAAMLLRGVCSALAAAHARGIIHRDLKPDNIFLTPDPDTAIGERPKLLDFGIAKLTDVGLAGSATKTGAVMGTPTYMSPEQCRGTGDVDDRADLYSIGCIFYELVTGRPPFTNLGAGELIGAHLYLDPDPPTVLVPTLGADTVALIMALLHKRPAERPQTAKELGQRLGDLAQKLGWITASSPSGVTGPVLTDLAMRAQTAAIHPTELPLSSQLLVTPGGSAAPSLASLERSLDNDIAAEKPTTLSGAASQLDLPRRSRKGIGFAMVAAAVLAGGAVAAFQLNAKTEPATPAKAPIVEQHATPVPSPVETPKPVPSPPPPSPVEPVESKTNEVVATPADPIEPKPPEHADGKREQERRRGRVHATVHRPDPKKPEDKKPPEPVKPKPTLMETDID